MRSIRITRFVLLILLFCLKILYDWLQARKASALAPASIFVGTTYFLWHHPSPNIVKCNSDAVIFVDSGEFGMRTLLSDAAGNLLTYKIMRLPSLPRVNECEALTLQLLSKSEEWVE
ncbi:hypothetical protein PTKIN_Ptkin05aG0116700 [Pterospermum kingtungense]